MLKRVKIQNFKSIGEPGVDLELKPLTFLVGPNGGGKSSILEAIGVAIQKEPSGLLTTFQSWGDIVHQPFHSMGKVDIYFRQSIPTFQNPGFRLYVMQSSASEEYLSDFDKRVRASPNVANLHELMAESKEKVFLLSSVRGNLSYTVSAGSNPTWVGVHGEHLLTLLAKIYGRREFDEAVNKITSWANRFGVEGLRAGLWGGSSIGSEYVDKELKTTLNLALSSSGAKQILTVITQLFWAPEGSLLMIEEPEISLHPAAQIDVLEMFAEAIKEDKQIIATTHGLFLIQAIGYAIQKGWLKSEDVAVHHVEKKKDTGTVAKQLPLNEKGYIKGWIPSFTRVERKLMLEWIKTLPEE